MTVEVTFTDSCNLIITFSYQCMVEKALFRGQVSEIEILPYLCVFKSAESENRVHSV